ncbi:MAG: UDP-N-acetylglucosamine 2-epimerase (non-hydrolyzing) [Planctomycetota bacterium]|nr:MAG: UDP-N-acetylglucosamine 2-epimerase (non-hydrolyzing) [Planctomycetota bacterium]
MIHLKRKILCVFGTRPEAIKMAPVVKKLIGNPLFETKVCLTGQHREMLDQVMSVFDLITDFDLDIMEKGQTLAGVTCKVLDGMEKVFLEWKPDCVLVQGDTTTVFSAALAAFYHKIKVGHIEAGLRTHNRYSPFPEEMSRCLASELASIHFAPTERARQNLLNEDFSDDTIFVTGNTVIDALFEALDHIDSADELKQKLERQFAFLDSKKKLILVTGHRRENHGEGFQNICQAIRQLAQRDDVQIVYPVHLNPNVKKPAHKILGDIDNIHLIEPLDYLSFIFLMQKSYLVLTDSGGVQEEAPSLGKPVLVMRDTTERPEAVDAGTVLLVGPDRERIIDQTNCLLDEMSAYEAMSKAHNPYGDGKAAERIIKILEQNILSGFDSVAIGS